MPYLILTVSGSLSDQLYQTPTRFLLELIQNADDNSYGSEVTPTLHLILYEKDGQQYFRTDCNEVGFSLTQLDALLQIGQSPKSAVDGHKGYIGEKGIGFKSVFKVSDVVHVASGFYEFMLDRNQPIGMILPILSRFPRAHRVATLTQFLLEIKNKDAYEEIQEDIKCIEPYLLMFLRKLNILQVSTPSTAHIFTRSCSFDALFAGETATIVARDQFSDLTQETKYLVERHIVRDLPLESRRERVATSEVIVAFPIEDTIYPIIKDQKAFAFLPIANEGFKVSFFCSF